MTDEQPRIVVLDGYTSNPGDLSWDPLRALGDCQIYDRTEAHEVLDRLADASIALTNKVVLSADVLAACPKLKYVGVLATGFNVVDIEAAGQHGVAVTNVPSYSTASVAQVVFAHVLHLAHQVGQHTQAVRSGRWSASQDFCFWDTPQVELAGMTMGIVGLGQIGTATAALAHAFGMNVMAHVRTPRPVADYIQLVELDQLFRESDVVSLHCPLTAETEALVDARRLGLMKSTAWLINTGRGPLIDESALAEALNSETISAAALDVLSSEPPPETNPLIQAKNCFITPHYAWASRQARRRLLDIAVENVASYLGGAPQNLVSG